MVKPVTQVNTQFFFVSFLWKLSENIEFLEWFLGVNQAFAQADKTYRRQTRGFTSGCLHFLFFRRGSYKSSYSLYTFLLEGEVNILKKNCSTSQCFYVQSRTINRQYNSVLANFVKLPANLWSREDILNCLYNYFKDLIMCAQSKL